MTKTELKKYSIIELETILKRVNEMLLIPVMNEFNLNNQQLKEMQKELNKELSKRRTQLTQIEQLKKISNYINKKYLDNFHSLQFLKMIYPHQQSFLCQYFEN